ncbi:MAG: DMT family transporter [Muribaculaceae bacterium]|nr:DMT family transporter [Muribaculaceae bacterium]
MSSIKNSKYMIPLGHLAALLTVMAWGSSFICTKVLMEEGGFTPVETYIYRFALAYLVLLVFTIRHIRSRSWRDELQFFLCGICSGTVYFITENYALLNTSAGNVSLLSGISPIFTTLLMALIYKTRVSKGVMLGSLAAFIGVGCVIFSTPLAQGLGMEINPLGDLLALSSALSWAIYAVAIKSLIPHYSTFFVTRKLFFYGVITAIPFLLAQNEPTHLATLFTTPHYLLNLLFLVLMCSLMAYIFWNEAMKIIGPVSTNNYLYLQAPVTMIVAYFVFGEQIYALGYVGCVLIIGGLMMADKYSR